MCLARPAQSPDQPHLVRFIRDMAQESEARPLDEQTVRQGVAQVFANPAIARYWVVEDTDAQELVAMCMVTTEWSDWHNRFYWWVQSVYVAPAYRGQGLLAQLMATVEAAARDADVHELRLYVAAENPRAIRAYEKQGWMQGHYQVMQKIID